MDDSTDRIRLATMADVRAIATIHVEGWHAAYRGIVPPELLASRTIDSREREFAEVFAVASLEERCWLMERDGEPVAFAYTRPGHDTDIAAAGELKFFYTLPSLRGNGIGGRLFDHAIGDLVGRGMNPYLYTFRENAAARAWYEHQGWRADGVSAPWSDRGEYPELLEVRYRPAQ